MERLKGLRIVATGGAGFIGSHLVGRLLGLGAEVTITDNFLFGSKVEHFRGHKTPSILEKGLTEAMEGSMQCPG